MEPCLSLILTDHGVYFRSERRWTHECSCQWSQTGTDTSVALRHRPHHPAQHKSESACGALRWIKEIRQFSGERCNAKGNKANTHTNWVKTWFSAAIKKTFKLYTSKSEGRSLFGLGNNASGCFRCPLMDYRDLLYHEGWVTSRETSLSVWPLCDRHFVHMLFNFLANACHTLRGWRWHSDLLFFFKPLIKFKMRNM